MYVSKHPTANIVKKALLIGIDYGNSTVNRLHGAVADAQNLRSLCSLHNFDCELLTEQAATRSSILQHLEKLAYESKSLDRVVISFSGHGSHRTDRNNDEEDGQDEFIVTYDNQYILDDELKAILLKFSPFCKVLFLIDACHSGTGVDLPIRYVTDNCLYVENTIAPLADILFISGCRDNETSSDMREGDTAFGLFTHSFIANYCKFGNVFDMMDQIRNECKKVSGQIPQMSSSRLIPATTKITDYLF